jgi:hypothetical protein
MENRAAAAHKLLLKHNRWYSSSDAKFYRPVAGNSRIPHVLPLCTISPTAVGGLFISIRKLNKYLELFNHEYG